MFTINVETSSEQRTSLFKPLHRRHPQYFIPLHSIHTVGNLTSKISFSWICMRQGRPIFFQWNCMLQWNTFQSQWRHTFQTKNRKCSKVRLRQGPWSVAWLAQLEKQRTSVPRVVGSSPTPGSNTFLPNVTLLSSEVILIIYLKHQPETLQTC